MSLIFQGLGSGCTARGIFLTALSMPVWRFQVFEFIADELDLALNAETRLGYSRTVTCLQDRRNEPGSRAIIFGK